MKLGEVLKKQLLQSQLQRVNTRLTKANEEMIAAIKDSGEGELTIKCHCSYEDAAPKMEDSSRGPGL